MRDAGSQIGVTALCPGVVLTGISQSDRNRPADLVPQGGVKGDDSTNLTDYAAAKSIGTAAAQGFAAAGAKVILADIDAPALRDSHAGLAGDGPLSILLNVTSEDGWNAAA